MLFWEPTISGEQWHILGLFPPVFGMEQCLFCSVRCSNGNFGCLELILVGGGKFIMILQIEFDHSCFIAITKIGCESLKLYLLVAKKKISSIQNCLVALKVLSNNIYIHSILNLT